MPQKSHSRGSQELTLRRRRALIVRLLQGPATKQELMEIIEGYADQAEDTSDKAIERRLEEDRRRVREWFGCDLKFDRLSNAYVLNSLDEPLIDLPNSALRAVAFLQQTFSDPSTPMSQEVSFLVNQLLLLLPEMRKKQISRERGLMELDLRRRDNDEIPIEVTECIQQAISQHRLLEFNYLSPQQEDENELTYKGEPIRYYFDSVRSHFYFEVYVISISNSKSQWLVNQIRTLRIGRMSHLRILPDRFLPDSRSPQRFELIYELTPYIARLGVTKHFPNSTITLQPDGSAIVETVSTNLFFDLQTLLHYGPGCRVLGGDTAKRKMRELVMSMTANYENE
jgi:predicted DNA-binding transcriptional regulator YafY